MPITDDGLRELKKRQTREAIAATARRLFLERGFEAVTVAEIAREAEVAEKTVFNYFPTKEDLFYSRTESFGLELLDAVANRRARETVLEAFRRFALTPRGLLALDDASSGEAARSRAAVRVILESPALQARERQILEGYSASLAERLAEESGAAVDDVESQVVADSLIAVHRALLDYVRRRIVAGGPPEALRRDFRAQGRHAFARLGRGFGDYAPK